MIITTREQRKALKRIFDRGPIYPYITPQEKTEGVVPVALTYKQFRRRVQATFGMDNAIAVPWAGMWLLVETDGYTHS